jgi:hypothetical protein
LPHPLEPRTPPSRASAATKDSRPPRHCRPSGAPLVVGEVAPALSSSFFFMLAAHPWPLSVPGPSPSQGQAAPRSPCLYSRSAA